MSNSNVTKHDEKNSIPKKIYYGYCEYSSETIFLDQNKNFITSVNENDGNWRSEYFNPILDHFGIEMIRIDFTKLLKKFKKNFEKYEITADEIDYTKLNF